MARTIDNVVKFPVKKRDSFTSKVGEFYKENYETIENLGYTAVGVVCLWVLGAIIYRAAAKPLDIIFNYIIPN